MTFLHRSPVGDQVTKDQTEKSRAFLEDLNRLVENLKSSLGRKEIRILHIGNIANNGYLAARSERRIGIESHVLSLDYTHIMGSPEWEHCKVERKQLEHFSENFSDCSCGFTRPKWFHSGSTAKAVKSVYSELTLAPSNEHGEVNVYRVQFKKRIRFVLSALVSMFWKLLRPIGRRLIPIKFRARIIGSLIHKIRKSAQIDFVPLFSKFDIVNLYGSSPQFLAGLEIPKDLKTKFVATEHGTLRDYIFAKYPLSIDTKKGYEKSSVIFVTNQDCLPIAKNMLGPIVIPMPHPINDEYLGDFRKSRELELHKVRNSILIPSRHSVSLDIDRGKGNETVYQLVKEVARYGYDLKFTLIAWGDNVEGAQELLREEEKVGIVEWIDVLSRPLLKERMVKSLCILDQFRIEAYGAVTADAIGLGVPVITAHNCDNDLSYFGSCAPVFPARNSNEVLESIMQIMSFNTYSERKHFDESTSWYDLNLSEQISLHNRLVGYAESLQAK